MDNDPSGELRRLSDKIDSMTTLFDERLKNLEGKVNLGDRTMAQSLTTLSETVSSGFKNTERVYVRSDTYRLAHQVLIDQIQVQASEIRELKESRRRLWNAVATLVAGPVIAGLILFILTGGVK